LTKNPPIYSVSCFTLGGLELFWGAKSTNPPERRDWLPTDVYFKNCITKPSQVRHRPLGC